ncbi:T9SS type A sorting domain-containing protein [Bacteroides sp.]
MRLLILLFLFCCMGIHHAYGQTSVNTGNGDVSNGSGNVSYSIGQVFYAGAGNASGSIYPGVQQVYEILSEPVDLDRPKITLSIKVYPNPATDYIILSFNGADYTGTFAKLADSTGKTLGTTEITEAETKIEVSSYPVGMYYLYLVREQSIYKTFKIIKK